MPSRTSVAVAGLSGVVLGLAAGWWAVSAMNSSAVATYAAYELAEHEKAAVEAFAGFEPKAVFASQQFLLDYVERQHQVNWVSAEEYHRVTGYAHARAAQALIELGDNDKAEKELAGALAALAKIGISPQKEELLSAIRKGRNAPPSTPTP